jgi:hypothetical protein
VLLDIGHDKWMSNSIIVNNVLIIMQSYYFDNISLVVAYNNVNNSIPSLFNVDYLLFPVQTE